MVKKTSKITVSKPGSFTAWCKRHGFKGVTRACIAAGLRSRNARIRKKANFARNARKWNKAKKKRTKKKRK